MKQNTLLGRKPTKPPYSPAMLASFAAWSAAIRLSINFYELELEKAHSEEAAARRSQVGTGDRSEKIRIFFAPFCSSCSIIRTFVLFQDTIPYSINQALFL